MEEVGQEKYFELLKAWKGDIEKSYLEQHPHLFFSPIKHGVFNECKEKVYKIIFLNFFKNHLDIVNI